jgi:hypothetical protein
MTAEAALLEIRKMVDKRLPLHRFGFVEEIGEVLERYERAKREAASAPMTAKAAMAEVKRILAKK